MSRASAERGSVCRTNMRRDRALRLAEPRSVRVAGFKGARRESVRGILPPNGSSPRGAVASVGGRQLQARRQFCSALILLGPAAARGSGGPPPEWVRRDKPVTMVTQL